MEDCSSLYDHFGPGLTRLVTRPDLEDDCQRAVEDAVDFKVPLKSLDLHDTEISSLYEAGLALIRPDQHVAWRGNQWPGKDLLSLVLQLGQGRVVVPGRTGASARGDLTLEAPPRG